MRGQGKKVADAIDRGIWSVLERFSDNDLRLAQRAVRRFSSTNCGWSQYATREALDKMIESERASRRIRARLSRAGRAKGERK